MKVVKLGSLNTLFVVFVKGREKQRRKPEDPKHGVQVAMLKKEYYDIAKIEILKLGLVSRSFLMRKLRITYEEAQRIKEELENSGDMIKFSQLAFLTILCAKVHLEKIKMKQQEKLNKKNIIILPNNRFVLSSLKIISHTYRLHTLYI